jgi:hypothetical protein
MADDVIMFDAESDLVSRLNDAWSLLRGYRLITAEESDAITDRLKSRTKPIREVVRRGRK